MLDASVIAAAQARHREIVAYDTARTGAPAPTH
jgi:hypothetical protein